MDTITLPQIIEQHIKKMYPNWLQQSERMCHIQGLNNEAKDILQEVICYVLEHYHLRINELYQTQKKSYNSLDALIISILKTNIQSPTAPYHQKYLKNQPPADKNIELNELQVSNEDAEPDLWELAMHAFHQLQLPENEKAIFRHYYIEHRKLGDWEGSESISKLSRICNHIVKVLREKIKQDSLSGNAKKSNNLYFINEAAKIKTKSKRRCHKQ